MRANALKGRSEKLKFPPPTAFENGLMLFSLDFSFLFINYKEGLTVEWFRTNRCNEPLRFVFLFADFRWGGGEGRTRFNGEIPSPEAFLSVFDGFACKSGALNFKLVFSPLEHVLQTYLKVGGKFRNLNSFSSFLPLDTSCPRHVIPEK